MAMLSALVVRAAVGEASMDQPTTLREKVPRTTAQYTLPGPAVAPGSRTVVADHPALLSEPVCRR